MSTINEQIDTLVAAGNALDNILVNDGNDAWGDDCAITTAQADAIRADWASDDQDVSDLPELPTAREWLSASAPIVTICANIETLESIWSDIFEDAGLTHMGDYNAEIANIWAKTMADALDDAGIAWEYEQRFGYWHGGPGHGTYHYQGDDPRVAAAASNADVTARAAASADVEALAEAETE